MDPAALIAVIAALVGVAVLFLLLGRRLGAAGREEVAALRLAQAGLEQRLAVADSLAARLPAAEARAREAERAEAALAAAQDSLTALRAAHAEQAADLTALRLRVEEFGAKLGQEAALVAERTRAVQQAQDALAQARAEAEQHRQAAAALRTEQATLGETLAQERRQAEEKLALLTAVGADMQAKFKTIADAVIAQHGDTLAKKNLEQLDTTLTPLRLKLVEFQQGLQTAHTDSEKERARLAEQIKTLSETSARMTGETHNLAQALRGRSQTQGAWGEMILATILEKSGLRPGEEYEAQASHTTEDGERQRPDVIVRLPGDQRIVIDAKVSLTAYELAVAAENEEALGAARAAHARSVRQHIRTLGGKDYQKHTPGALDYVVMFMPIEGALAMALDEDDGLIGYAIENSVFVATPTTLMIALRTAANVWNVERRNRNAEDIADRAGKIYDKMDGFLKSMALVDKSLSGARENYDKAMGQLSTGKGNMLRQLDQLKRLGAKTSKTLPGLLTDDGEEAEA